MSIVKINNILKVEEGKFKVISSGSPNSSTDNTPTYALYRSPSLTDEGTTVTYTLATTNLTEGTLVSYTVTGISQDDLSSGSLTGDFIVDVVGIATVSFTIANDGLTEGAEIMSLSAGGQSLNVTIIDTSTTPTYSLSRSSSSVDEGSIVTYTLNTTNVAEGTLVSYIVTGITEADISSGSLTGNFTVDAVGTATVSFTIASDVLTEGTETMTLSSGGQSLNVTINDTSITAVAAGSPVIVKDPGPSAGALGPLVLTVGSSGTFYATVSSTTSFTYRWKRNGDYIGPTFSGSAGSNVTATLYVNKVAYVGQGLFTVVATNASGTCESNPSMLTVLTSTPKFASASLLRAARSFSLASSVESIPVDLTANSQTVSQNDYLSVNINADPRATFTWLYTSIFETSWITLSQIGKILDLSDPLIRKDCGGFARLSVTVNGVVSTLMFRIETYSAPLVGFNPVIPDLLVTTQPSSLTLNNTQWATFRVSAQGIPVSYNWYREDFTTGISSLVASSVIPYLTFGPVQASDAGNYYVVVTDYWGNTTESLRAGLIYQ